MACYSPNRIIFHTEPSTGETYFEFAVGRGYEADGEKVMSVPCGKCIGCRLDKSREWSDRMMLELDHSKTAIFCTLTYAPAFLKCDDDGIPVLSKRDVQLFLKRLRAFFEGKRLRYYLCGEYGPNGTHRPHYHAIIFGLSIDDFADRVLAGKNKFGQEYFSSDKLNELWSNGFCSFSSVSSQTCSYVAAYCNKKVFKEFSPARSVKEFSLSSRRPGIGGFFYDDHPDYDSLSFLVKDNTTDGKTSKRVNISKYQIGKLAERDPQKAYALKKRKLDAFSSNLQSVLTLTDLDAYSYLKEQEAYALMKHKSYLMRKEAL